MKQKILSKLLEQRIPPEQFHLEGLEVVFTDPEINNKPCTAPNESPYDTPENRAIVEDVIKNYDSLEKEYLAAQEAIAYKARRAVEYPDYRDYLDGIVKGDQAQIDTYIKACLAVKAKYPKG